MNSNFSTVRRGQIYWLDWNPARGSEQAGRRPGLVIQEDAASANPNYPLSIVLTISSRGRNIPTHIAITPSEQNGLSVPSYVKCEQIQTTSKDRLLEYIGELESEIMARVDQALKQVLILP